jgi:lipopolysaccharide assembly outer membrane protein LptD (OstA)
MLELISPQEVKNKTEDYVVYVEDRYHVKYESKDKIISVEVDFGQVVSIYSDSLECNTLDNKNINVSEEEKRNILKKITESLQFMGCKTNIC